MQNNNTSTPTTAESAELAFKENQDKRLQEFALASLTAQERHLESQRQHDGKCQKHNLIYSGIVFTFLLVFAGFALYFNKESFLLDMTSYLFTGVGGGGIGYALGRRHSTDQN